MNCRTFAVATAILVSLPLAAAPACAAPASATMGKAGITAEDWGTTQKGEKVELFTLTGKGGLVAKIANFGGAVVDLMAPDRHGAPTNVVLGYDDLASYEKGGIFSALIGPYANRLGLKFPVAGQMYQQPTPAPRPVPPGASPPPVRNFIQHSGPNGFQKRVWEAVMHDGAEPSLSLTIKNPDGIGGMPGNTTVTVTYTVRADNTLVLDYRGVTDRPTVMNLTNHFYFNLNGAVKNIDDQTVTLFASRFAPYDRSADSPSGVIAPVSASPYDFRNPVRIGDRLSLPDVYQPVGAGKIPGYDAYFLVDGRAGRMRRAARVSDPDTGIVMDTFTTEPGVQFYTDNIAGQVNGKKGAVYGNHWAISLETGKAPDTPNHPNFPSAEVTPTKPLHETTEYRFSAVR
jgi:aldose 1-epimerase